MTYTADQKQALQAYLRFADGDDRLWDPTLEQHAIAEDAWSPFLESLRASARTYAQRGRPFIDWVVEASRTRDRVLEKLYRTHSDLAPASQIARGLMLVHDLALETMARSYVEAKQTHLEDTLRRSETQLQHAQKMEALGRLAGGVAHDFNNILTIVGSYAAMLEESLDPSDQRRGDASEIGRAAERATKLTRQLLTLSRQSPVTPRSVNITELVTAFVPTLRRLFGTGIKLELQLDKPSVVVVDPSQLEQVIMNLAVNARDAMNDNGRVLVATSLAELDGSHGAPPGRFVMLSVTDNGPGIPPDVQKRVFDPFFTTKEVGKGTGLGLAIVQGIVTQAGGAVELYSEPDHGTTFRIYLPASSEQPVPDPQEAETEAPALRPLTVLYAEEQREVRELGARVLGAHGCTVFQAATGAEAREICVKHEGAIDVALVDLALPDGRGDLVLRDLRALRPDLHLILTSGFPAGALQPTNADPVMVLAKPFSPARLRDAVATVTAEHRPVRRSEPSLVPKVLLVDDDPSLRKMLGKFLRRSMFEVVEADSGRSALHELGAQRFDVILSDIHMPDGTGLDLLRGVRRVDLDVPVILISGKPDVETAAAALEFGAFRYLSKPVDVEALDRTVRTAIRAHSLARLRREALNVGRGNANAIADRAGLEARFDSAVESLWMAYQPIVTRTGASFGVEALMRTREATLPTPPAVLDAAAQLDRLPQLGRRIRNLVAAVLDERADVPSVFVNLHPDDLFDAHLIDESAPLTRHAARVVLEITEREALTSSTALTERIARLRTLGFRLAVDDIGAGYSGLTSFTDLTPEIVKIDMSLVRSIHTSKVKQRTVAALCSLCHDMGALVVGEGVETTAEHECLLALGCDLLQGYLLAKPMAVIA